MLLLKTMRNSGAKNNLQQQLLVRRDLETMEINETKLSHFPKTVQKQNTFNSHEACIHVKFVCIGLFRSLIY